MTLPTSRAPVLGLAVLLLMLVAGCSKQNVTVPKVTGEESDVYEAYERLTHAGFAVEITHGFRTGPSCACRNPIVEQWPPAGTGAESGSAVEITVGGPGPPGSGGMRAPEDRNLQLPNLVGRRLDRAERWLATHQVGWVGELAALPATKEDDLLKSYVVTSQDPEGGYVPGRNFVVLEAAPTEAVRAKWKEATVVVPHVSGDEHLLGAYARLHARGLRATTDRRLKNAPYIPVLAQRPAPGASVRRGTTVLLILDPSFKPQPVCCDARTLAMPSFVGRNLGPVAAWLLHLGLPWEVDAPALPPTGSPNVFNPYVVTSQTPRPGTTIPQPLPESNIKPIKLRARLVRH